MIRSRVGGQQHASNTIAMLALTFLVFLPLEGILRKWLLNPIQQPLAFLRDPVLLAIYFAYAKNMNYFNSNSRIWLPIWCVVLLSTIALASAQSFLTDAPLIVYLIGIRNYVLFIPLMFILAESLTEEGVARIVRLTLWLSIPVGALVLIQFFSPVAAPINKGLDDNVKGRFLVVAGIVRPYGPFTFTQAQTYFSLMCVAALVAAFERRKRYSMPIWLLASSAIATAVMGALSGSRTFFVSTVLLTLFYALPGFFGANIGRSFARILGIAFATAVFGIIFVIVFPTAYTSMVERQAAATSAEGSIFDRSASILTSAAPSLKSAPALGFGIGAGSNMATAARGIVGYWTLGEYDWPRMINELGPAAGLIAIAARVALTLWIISRCLIKSVKTGDASPMPMCGLAALLLIGGQIVGQNQSLSFCWFVAGLALAMSADIRVDNPAVRLRRSGL